MVCQTPPVVEFFFDIKKSFKLASQPFRYKFHFIDL